MASLIHTHASFILIGLAYVSLCQNVSTDYYDYGFPSENATDCSEDDADCNGDDTFVFALASKDGML